MDVHEEYALRKFVAPEFVFGADARFLAGRYARNFGCRKMLVVTDPNVVEKGWSADVVRSLEEAGIAHALFSGVSPNPRAEEVMEGARVFAEEDCDSIMAVGGGSPMDCAKGIGVVAAAPESHVLDYVGIDEVNAAIPPLICIPTTAGTAAELSQYAIITDSERRLKTGIISKAIVPDVALIDPVPTTTVDCHHTACIAMDALAHAFEAYVSAAHSPVTDLHALEGMRLVWNNLLPLLEEPQSLLYRSRIMLGSLHAGLAFSNAGLGLIHAMAHSLGGLLDFAHGDANSLVFASVVGYNFEAAPERYRAIAEHLGVTAPGASQEEVREALMGELAELRLRAGIETRLAKLGVGEAEIPALAATTVCDYCLITNPRRPTKAEVERLYVSLL